MGIPEIAASDFTDRGADLLEQAGCLVVTDVASAAQVCAVREEMTDVMANTPVNMGDDANEFYPGKTRRGTSLVAHSETARDFVMHPICKAACDHFLLPNCEQNGRYQLHVTAAIEIGPGARKQVLHREEDPFAFFQLPRPNLIVATMWAVTDFTAENGGTLLVPGSHKWDASRQPEAEEVFSAEMPAGSVLFWLGGTLHGGGANLSKDWRYGVILTYSLGWLRQEENQSLAVPHAVARQLTPELRDMIGDTMNGSLGFHFYKGIEKNPEPSGESLSKLNT